MGQSFFCPKCGRTGFGANDKFFSGLMCSDKPCPVWQQSKTDAKMGLSALAGLGLFVFIGPVLLGSGGDDFSAKVVNTPSPTPTFEADSGHVGPADRSQVRSDENDPSVLAADVPMKEEAFEGETASELQPPAELVDEIASLPATFSPTTDPNLRSALMQAASVGKPVRWESGSIKGWANPSVEPDAKGCRNITFTLDSNVEWQSQPQLICP